MAVVDRVTVGAAELEVGCGGRWEIVERPPHGGRCRQAVCAAGDEQQRGVHAAERSAVIDGTVDRGELAVERPSRELLELCARHVADAEPERAAEDVTVDVRRVRCDAEKRGTENPGQSADHIERPTLADDVAKRQAQQQRAEAADESRDSGREHHRRDRNPESGKLRR